MSPRERLRWAIVPAAFRFLRKHGAGTTVMHAWRFAGELAGRRPPAPEAVATPALSAEEKRAQQTHLRPAGAVKASRLAIGIVTYNNPADQLGRCLHSARNALRYAPGGGDGSVFLVDNGAATEPGLLAAQRVERLAGEGNVGFGAGHNRLMAAAFAGGADYYIAANPDGAFHPGCVAALVEMAQAADDRALVEAVQFPEEHPKTFDRVSFDTSWASGACLLIPRPIYQAIGGFDASFFLYCEDVDLSWRARAAGFKVKTCPRAIFFHPVVDRPFDIDVHRQYLTSGYILARKWGGRQFEGQIGREAQKYGLDLSDIPLPEEVTEPGGIGEFSYAFHFSPARW